MGVVTAWQPAKNHHIPSWSALNFIFSSRCIEYLSDVFWYGRKLLVLIHSHQSIIDFTLENICDIFSLRFLFHTFFQFLSYTYINTRIFIEITYFCLSRSFFSFLCWSECTIQWLFTCHTICVHTKCNTMNLTVILHIMVYHPGRQLVRKDKLQTLVANAIVRFRNVVVSWWKAESGKEKKIAKYALDFLRPLYERLLDWFPFN